MRARVIVWALLGVAVLTSLPMEAPADECVNPSCLCDCPLPCCPGGLGVPTHDTTLRAPAATDLQLATEQRQDLSLRDLLDGIDRPPQFD
jgi:hypothetical protein